VSLLSEVVEAASDPLLEPYVVADPPPGRFEQTPEDRTRAFVLETVYEGYLLHYGEPRAFAGMDADLRLLAGDALYALGLSRLAEAGDMPAVAELADLISLCARLEVEGRTDLCDELWDASARALSNGGGDGARATWESRLARRLHSA
jgi:hypothetical protein